MKIALGRLRQLLAEAVAEAKIAASHEYMRKEKVREHIQEHVVDQVKAGEIKDQRELEDFWSSADMAMKALKGVPYDVWTKMAGKHAKKST